MADASIVNLKLAGLDPDAVEDAWVSLVQAADHHQFGGAVALIARGGNIALHRATGWAVREPDDARSPMGVDTIFDLASLTKVVATTPSILHLIADGAFTLDTPARDLLPIFAEENVPADITVRRLMTHSAGLISWLPVFLQDTGPESYLRAIARDGIEQVAGEHVVYSDPSFISLGEIVRQVSGLSVADYAHQHVFEPLGMTDTMFTPPAAYRSRIAATELGNAFEAEKMPDETPVRCEWRTGLIRGDVHDGNAWYGLDGIAGHAGLFGTALDLFRYGQMWLNGGESAGTRLLPDHLIAEATTEQIVDDGERRGLGWQLAPGDAATEVHSGRGVGPRGYGHTGFTGTSIWIDPDAEMVVVLLTNRVHPTVSDAYQTTRSQFMHDVFGAAQ